MEVDLRDGDIAWEIELRISNVGGQAQSPPIDIQALLDRYTLMFEDIPPG